MRRAIRSRWVLLPAVVAVSLGLLGADFCGMPADYPALIYPDQCQDAVPPDEACYVSKRDPSSAEVALARDIGLRYLAEHPAGSLPWNWEEGVLMVAMVELHRLTGDARFRDYYQAYIDHHLAAGVEFVWSDSCPPVNAAIALYDETGDPAYRALVEEMLTYLLEIAPRNADGGISHMGTISIFGETLWLDSLFMFGMPLLRWSELTEDWGLLDEVGRQFAIFGDRLQDATGFLVHAADWPAPQDPGVYWARGNAWVTAAGHEYVRLRRKRNQYDGRVEYLLERQAAAIAATQDATGLWWTVVNRPGETYLETSASALFAYGLARGYRYGVRDESVLPIVWKAIDGLAERVVYDAQNRPYVVGTSGPTGVGGFANYAGVPLVDDLSYGVGAVILALLEASGLPDPR